MAPLFSEDYLAANPQIARILRMPDQDSNKFKALAKSPEIVTKREDAEVNSEPTEPAKPGISLQNGPKNIASTYVGTNGAKRKSRSVAVMRDTGAYMGESDSEEEYKNSPVCIQRYGDI